MQVWGVAERVWGGRLIWHEMPMNMRLTTEFNYINEFAAIAYHACCTCEHGAGRWARWTVMVALGRARDGTARHI